MRNSRLLAALALRVILAALVFAAKPSGSCDNCPRVELERKGKPIIAVKTSPDDVSDVFVIEYLDVQIGPLDEIDYKALTASMGEIKFWWNGRSKICQDCGHGDLVKAVYNPDISDGSGRYYLLELQRYGKNDSGHFQLQKFIIYDPKPYRTQVRFADDAMAFGHLAQVERVKGLYQRILLAEGAAKYLPDEDRFTVALRDSPGAVEIDQGKSRAFGARLLYDNDSGLAKLTGPVTFSRDGDEKVSGSAAALSYQVDDKTLTLTGNVVLKQGKRTTTASSALIVEASGYAYLYGDPVLSRSDSGEVKGKELMYNLDSGDILVLQGVNAVFEDAP